MVGAVAVAVAALILAGWTFYFLCVSVRRFKEEIARLGRENLSCANALRAQVALVGKVQADADTALRTAEECKNSLTSEPAKPKIVPKTASSWSAVQSAIAAENAKIEREEA